MIEKPKLRPVEAFPSEYQGKAVIALRDPQGYTESVIFIPQEVIAIVSLFDGEHTILDIQEAFTRQSDQILYGGQIQQLIQHLDQHHFLDSPSFQAHKYFVEQSFHDSVVRPATHAGSAYEGQPDALRRQLNALFRQPGGPGVPDLSLRCGPLHGLIVPHIDLHRGGVGYAYSYKTLVESTPADLYVILGVAHSGSEHRFILSEKDFETPLGIVKTDRGFVRRMQALVSEDLLANEISHKSEHSIEFQIIFLQHLMEQHKEFQIVPILVGSFHDLVQSGMEPDQNPSVTEFLRALSQALEEARQARRVCLIAAVDLSHVGQRFGDREDLTPEFLDRVKKRDQLFLGYVESKDPTELYQMIYEENDWRKVCGFPAIYTFLKVLPEGEGTLLDYQQWADPPSGCSVSFASLAFR